MSNASELKPCPFCGGEADVLAPYQDCSHVMCRDCGMDGPHKMKKAEAIAAWNTRPGEDAARREGAERASEWWRELCRPDEGETFNNLDFTREDVAEYHQAAIAAATEAENDK